MHRPTMDIGKYMYSKAFNFANIKQTGVMIRPRFEQI